MSAAFGSRRKNFLGPKREEDEGKIQKMF